MTLNERLDEIDQAYTAGVNNEDPGDPDYLCEAAAKLDALATDRPDLAEPLTTAKNLIADIVGWPETMRRGFEIFESLRTVR